MTPPDIMLTVQRCRQILGPSARVMSDRQIERLRDQLYGLAEVTVSMFVESRKQPPEAGKEGSS